MLDSSLTHSATPASVVVGAKDGTPEATLFRIYADQGDRHVVIANDLETFVEAAKSVTGPVVAAFGRDMVNRMALNRVKGMRANVVRIAVLPVGADRSAHSNAGYAHQFLHAEELGPASLQAGLLRALEPSSERRCDAFKRLLVDDIDLPPTPAGLSDLLERLDDPTASMGSIAAVLEKDPGLTAKTLKLANSAYFGLPRNVSSVTQAVNFLGIECIKSFALGSICLGAVSRKRDRLLEDRLEHIRRQGLATSQLIRQVMGREAEGTAMTAAILQDIGQGILIQKHRRAYADLVTEAKDSGQPLSRLEVQRYGISHAEVGAAVLAEWGLPDALVELVAFSHSVLPHPSKGTTPLAILILASTLSEESRFDRCASAVSEEWALTTGFSGKIDPSCWRQAADEIQMKWPGG